MDKKTLNLNCEKVLTDFFNRTKSDKRIFSVDDINSCFSFSFKLTPYKLLNESGRSFIKEKMSEIVFGLKSGIVFTKENVFTINYDTQLIREISFNDIENLKVEVHPNNENMTHLTFHNQQIVDGNKLFEYEEELFNEIKGLIGLEVEKFNKSVENELHKLEDGRLSQLETSQNSILNELDKNGDGEVDIIEGNDFNNLLKKHQKIIGEIDRNYIQQFVKVSSYLKTKKENIQSVFTSIKNTPNQEVLNEYTKILKDEIHVYNLILFNSLKMIVSLIEDDMITFFEIHERFDNLNIFDSKHERDMSQKLTNIGDGLESLMYEVRDMGNRIESSMYELTNITEESKRLLEKRLSEIDSSIKTNNLITLISTYQSYKTNKNINS